MNIQILKIVERNDRQNAKPFKMSSLLESWQDSNHRPLHYCFPEGHLLRKSNPDLSSLCFLGISLYIICFNYLHIYIFICFLKISLSVCFHEMHLIISVYVYKSDSSDGKCFIVCRRLIRSNTLSSNSILKKMTTKENDANSTTTDDCKPTEKYKQV